MNVRNRRQGNREGRSREISQQQAASLERGERNMIVYVRTVASLCVCVCVWVRVIEKEREIQ